ncbi:MAG: glycosyltransferase [Halieaceae bacterium]
MKYRREILEEAEDSLARITQLIADHATVLDLGVGTGELGQYLSKHKHCTVDGVDQSEQHLEIARPHYRRLEQVNLEQQDALQAFADQRYDYVVLADVLEHVMDVPGVLERASALLQPDGELLLSVPNIGYAGVCLELLEGRFDYRSEGILDDTHVRFYTRDSLLSRLTELGYSVLAVDTVRKPLHQTEFARFAPELLPASLVDLLLERPDSLVYQYILRVQAGTDQPDQPAAQQPGTGTGIINQFETRLYWMGGGDLQHNEDKLLRRWTTLSGDDAVLEFSLGDEQGIEVLRYSPADRAGVVTLQSFSIRNTRTGEVVDICSLPFPEQTLSQNMVVEDSPGAYRLLCMDSNAWFEIDLKPLFGEALSGEAHSAEANLCELEISITQSWPMSQDYSALLAIYEDVNQRAAALADQVVEHRAHRRGLAGEIALLKESVANREAEIEQLQRQTTPSVKDILGTLRSAVRKLGRIIRGRYQLELSAITNGERDEATGQLQMTGDSGHLYFQTAPRLRGKTVFFNVSYSSQSRLMGPKLYRVIDGELEEITAPIYEDRSDSDFFGTLILPEDLQGLVLAPSRLDSQLNIDSFSIKILGPLAMAVADYWHWIWYYRVFGPGWVWRRWLDECRMFFENFPRLGKRRSYADWWHKYGCTSRKELDRQRSQWRELASQPRVSIVMPTYNTAPALLEKAIQSVLEQTYPEWELCIADDCSNLPESRAALERLAQLDPRIKLKLRQENGHISAATNDAIALASGDYLAFMDHDDELTPDALYHVVSALQGTSPPSLIYSDEDIIDESGQPMRPHFKPDWNPDYLCSVNYFCHLLVIRQDLVTRVGGLREGFEGAQDYDLILRVVAQLGAAEIHHIPRVLYHWRAIAGSTADDISNKDYAVEAGRRALQDYVEQTKTEAEVEISELGMAYRLHHHLPQPAPSVEILIPTRDSLAVLSHCINSLLSRSSYTNYSINILDNDSSEADCLSFLDEIQADPRVTVTHYAGEFNFSAIMNHGAQGSQADVLLLLNNDVEIISADWMEEMVSQAMRDGVGAVGAKLYYATDYVQHAGVVLGVGPDAVAGHGFKGAYKHDTGHMGRLRLVQNYSAVTAACLAVKRTRYLEVGGLDETELKIAFNDVDFCLKLREAGYRNVWTPYAQLYHFESWSRGADSGEKRQRFEKERDYMQEKWGASLYQDPAYNPNLTLEFENFDFAWPPRPSSRSRQTAAD